MLIDIYALHDAAFKRVSAFVVLKGGERVATVAFKFPEDGAGRLYAYVHWIGLEMVRGHANGYGYDKKSAAVESAVVKIKGGECSKQVELAASEFVGILKDCGGDSWEGALRKAGFTVLSAL